MSMFFIGFGTALLVMAFVASAILMASPDGMTPEEREEFHRGGGL